MLSFARDAEVKDLRPGCAQDPRQRPRLRLHRRRRRRRRRQEEEEEEEEGAWKRDADDDNSNSNSNSNEHGQKLSARERAWERARLAGARRDTLLS
eukprot:2056715-Rhodomonas_salina.2